MIIAETPRLILREWEMTDAGNSDHIYGDAETMAQFGSGRRFTRDELKASLARIIEEYRTVGYANYAVVDRTSGALIGHCGLRCGSDGERIEADWALAKSFCGKGLATEAADAVFTRGFNIRKFDRIWGVARVTNAASIAMMKKMGMSFVEQRTLDDVASVVYAVTADEFSRRER